MPAVVKQPNLPRPSRPAWYKANAEQKNEYTALLEQKLANIPLPASLRCDNPHCSMEEHIMAQDSHVLDVIGAVLESSHQCIPMSARCRPDGKRKVSLPGWRENVAPAKEDALFWHSIWLSAGRPNKGELYNVICWTRNKYHYAVRRAKRLADGMESKKLLEAAEV